MFSIDLLQSMKLPGLRILVLVYFGKSTYSRAILVPAQNTQVNLYETVQSANC